MTANWSIFESEKIPESLLKQADGDGLVARLLMNRNVRSVSDAKYYLDLKSVVPSHSYEIPEMDKAFNRIVDAINNKEKICVFGDYDVDGTTSVALIYRTFKMIGKEIEYYVPSRHSEGYGLNKNAIQKFRDKGTDLLITCDCGISNFSEVEFANSIGLDVIVTDHHSIPEITPPSVANCNPKTLNPEHPLHWLPGVGVAFKLAELILEKYIEDKTLAKVYTNSLLDLVALGMIADLAPLRAENRYLVEEGLKVLARTEKVGLRELMNACGVKVDPDAEHIGFGIAPRINAAGRLSDAMEAVKLMVTEDQLEAMDLASALNHQNLQRQKLCEETFEEAMDLIAEEIDLSKNCIAIAKEGWNHGVIGIVASRLVEKFHVPVFIMAIEKNVTKGSVRGINIENLDVYEEMCKIQEETNLFLKFGGHKAAAGFSTELKNTNKLCRTIMDHFQKRLVGEDIRKKIEIDTALKLNELSTQFLTRLEKLAPYGFENPQPKFIAGPLKVKSIRDLGKDGKHIKLFLEDETTRVPLEGVIWNRAEEFTESFGYNLGGQVTIVFSPKINQYRGESFLQLDIRDWKKPEEVDPKFFARFQALKV